MKKNTWLIVAIVAVVLLFGNSTSEKSEPVANFQKYLIAEEDFDFTPELAEVANNLNDRSNTDQDRIKNTLRFVYNHIEYNSDVSIQECFAEKASTILERGYGDCVSMTRLTVSLLRMQNVPIRSVGGCIDLDKTCGELFSVLPEDVPVPKPQLQDDYKKRGFLHEWAEAWTPETGWVLLETTNGKVYDINCDSYRFYSYDTNPRDRCVINNNKFFKECVYNVQ